MGTFLDKVRNRVVGKFGARGVKLALVTESTKSFVDDLIKTLRGQTLPQNQIQGATVDEIKTSGRGDSMIADLKHAGYSPQWKLGVNALVYNACKRFDVKFEGKQNNNGKIASETSNVDKALNAVRK